MSNNKKELSPIKRISEDDRLTTFPIPISRVNIWKQYKKHASTFWVVESIDFSNDKYQWETKLETKEQEFIKYILAFFAASDSIVAMNLAERFKNDINIPEVNYFYDFQIMMENIHAETYSTMLDIYIMDQEEKNKLLNAVETIPAVKLKADWARKWMNSKARFQERLVAFICVEGIFFSGSFCAIFWIRAKGILPGLCTGNEYINRDEGLHTRFGCLLYSMCDEKLTRNELLEIILDAVEIEKKFITEALPYNLKSMNANLMKQYIESVADNVLALLDEDPYFKSKNPFDFMEALNCHNKTNFFEGDTTDYQKIAYVEQEKELNLEKLDLDDCDF